MKKFVFSFAKVNIKTLALVLGLSVFIFTNTLGDEFKYADSWGKAGYSLEIENSSKVIVNYSIDKFTVADFEANGESMKNIHLTGHILPNNEGAPNLPGTGRYIAIPQGATAAVNILSYRTETINNVDIAPAPRIPWENEDGPMDYIKNETIYTANKFYPEEPVKISENDMIRGIDVVMLGITPFHYNPVTKQLIVYRDLKIEVTFQGGTSHFGEDRLRSRWWDPLLSDMLLNHESLPKMDYSRSFQATDDVGCEYLIVVPNDPEFSQWADSIKQFRTLQGISTDIKTIDEIGGNNVNTLENYFNNAFNIWDIVPAAVLLMADYGTSAANSITSPIWNNYCVSDNIFADVNNNDMPDMVFARMTAQNASHLEIMVTKFLDHERTPPTSADYYNNPITALGYQTERWFQICSESVAGFWEVVQGKTANRINAVYSGNPQSGPWSTNQNTQMVMDVFGPNGLGYIPATPGEVNCTWNGSGQDVINGINNGAFMLQHRDHGSTTGWGEPDFQSSDINALNNTDLTFVWSINCLTGKYNMSGECFAEKFHRHTSGGENSGALGINAASEVSYSFVNDTYVWGAFDNMWPDFLPEYGTTPGSRDVLPAFGNAAGKYFLQQSNWPYNTNNKEVTYNLFHHHGDAFMTVYSEIPQNLNVTHNPILYAGVTSFDVSADDGAFIALTVNGEIIATAEATGAPVSISVPGQVPPDQVLVTITKQNYYRYTSLVDVIPPTGPYVVRESFTISDNAGGNGDGLMDYSESNMLSLTVENVGVQQADNVIVTLSTADTYITITDNTENYGNIAANATAIMTDGFAYDVANDIPDGHNATFEVSATDGTETWLSYFSIEGHAPVMEFVDFVITDPAGNNNGKIDPGETVDITVEIENAGSSEAYNILGELSTTDMYLTVNTSSVDYGDLNGNGTANGTFSATAAPNTPAGHLANLEFDMTADLGIDGSGEFDVVIGQIPVLILDLDENGNSAPNMEDALGEMDVAYEKLSSFPPDLNLYSTIFVCLGIFSDNYVLSSSDGQVLADYLNNGGNLYMEGGDTWYYDNQTAVHAMFNINGTADGTSDMGTVIGQSGTMTEGMSFSYNGDNSWMDHLDPISPAVMIFENQSPNYGTGVAYDAGDYKTIGTSHEFGGLADGSSPSTKEELMIQYLGFLGITTSMQASFNSNVTEICEQETIEFFDQSNGDVISWDWTFEGGTPATSTSQNPTIVYNSAGVFDVTLTVSDGTDNSTITLEDYISVNSMPGTPNAPTGITEVCASGGNTSYSTTGLPGIDTYDWMLDPASAGTISGGGDNITIIWEDSFLGDVTLTVAGENICGAGNYSDPLDITRYLPEVSMEPFEDVCEGWPEYELTGGMPEGGEYSGPGVSNGMFDPGVAGLGTHTITYTYEDALGCSNYAEETIYVDPCTGIIENAGDQDVMIFPNPNNGTFTVQLNVKNNELVDLTIYNTLKEIVYKENNISTSKDYTTEVSLNDYAKGIYYLHITGEETNKVRKIIVQQ